ncbi:MAG: gliding motility-associated protein GldE [Candidatus Pseudobacter hemicellulosilyticus]|uniref:Gliding motility-associated protein GldE n=1 Tax=Candidatus Pseudobacter hemicellulosilyticus TaxID=3121375 RepID=A0AAJ6BJD4_9BACT|nr:MAG: gliding motility-associated protein GldE [Pseudobacter sp.]
MDNISTLFLAGNIFRPVLLLQANVQATTVLGAIILMLLLLSFFTSGAKLAFFSLTYRDINMLKTKQDQGWKRIANLLQEPRILQAALTVANSLVNIAIIILSNYLIDQILIFEGSSLSEGMQALLRFVIKMVVIASLIILFGEVLPKIRATQNSLRSAYETSFLVEILYYLFKRVGGWMVHLSDKVAKAFGGTSQQHMEDVIRASVHEENEQRILTGIYKFARITVKQVMRTRLDVNGIEQSISFGELKKKVEELHYSRLPIYKNSLDDIVGIINTKDLLPHLNEPDDFNWRQLYRTPYFVHQQKYIEDLLEEFQSKRIHFAVVVDEFGGTSGIITLEDILEEIIGEIKDEFDEEESGNRKIDDMTYLFEGNTMIHDVCKAMGLPADTFNDVKGDSDSLAGLVLELAGDIPKVNDMVSVGNFEFHVLEVERNRIRKVKVVVTPQVV